MGLLDFVKKSIATFSGSAKKGPKKRRTKKVASQKKKTANKKRSKKKKVVRAKKSSTKKSLSKKKKSVRSPKKAKSKQPKVSTTTAKLKKVGQVTHFFDRIAVSVIKLKKSVAVGDRLLIVSRGEEIEVPVKSMQIDHKPVERAKSGVEIGLKVPKPVREGDDVYYLDH